jgi:hypothetical protein
LSAIPPDINQQWRRWFDEQPQETRDALQAAWDATASEPGIDQRHGNAGYARRAALIAAAAQYGYAP